MVPGGQVIAHKPLVAFLEGLNDHIRRECRLFFGGQHILNQATIDSSSVASGASVAVYACSGSVAGLQDSKNSVKSDKVITKGRDVLIAIRYFQVNNISIRKRCGLDN